jgi:hypothetical protein
MADLKALAASLRGERIAGMLDPEEVEDVMAAADVLERISKLLDEIHTA